MRSDVLDRAACRKSSDTEIVANCIEAGTYDPCDDSGGSWGDAQCAAAHSLVAERRIKKALKDIRSKSFRAKFSNPNEIYNIEWSQRNWELYRDQFCMFKNAAFNNQELYNGEKPGYCYKRLNEARAQELENLMVK